MLHELLGANGEKAKELKHQADAFQQQTKTILIAASSSRRNSLGRKGLAAQAVKP